MAKPKLTKPQVMALLGIKRSTLRNWRLEGMPYEQYSERTLRYDEDEVVAWAEQNKRRKVPRN